jgi:ribosomal protein S18 acetylase RimI-like enzyme
MIPFYIYITDRLIASNSPWKQSQITKLRKSSTADLKGRRQRYPETNDMFLAYHVVEAEEGSASSFNINDLDRVYNFPADGKGDADYVRGDLLGFVEITQRSYNLGPDDETDERPFLTNLAVSNKARQSGIGSQLMEACERHVVDVWNMKDVALEVDYDNSNALAFYSKRGYQHIFSSSACQRYDASGLFLRKVQCTKEIMLKTLIV